MPLLDSALAFAITMLALSLACSAFVELIHRIFKMRQAGFKYMLEQMFDQVLSKYVEPGIRAAVAATDNAYQAKVKEAALKDPVKEASAIKDLKEEADKLIENEVKTLLKGARDNFVERMRANRAPMGVTPNATPGDAPAKVAENKFMPLGVWGGRELTELSPVGFMERLGTMDIGSTITNAAASAGRNAADYLDAALKDIAQKFEALGKDAADYFEGRARLISVVVAVVFAFVVHADAVDLYTTFLRNPGTTASVIAQSEAIQKQFTAAQTAAEAADKAKAAADAKKPADGTKPPENAQKPVTSDDGQKQFEDARDAAKAAKDGAEKMVKQFADLGVPLGWTDERYKTAKLLVLVWSCKDMPADSRLSWWTVWRTCKSDPKPATTATDGAGADLKYTNVWFGIPLNLGVLFYLVLGGLLIGLGAPFWFNVVTTITNLRNTAGGAAGATGSAAQAPGGLLALRAPAEADKAQPATPAGAFQVAQAAKKPE
jgi:hypothetical protein